MKAELRNHRKFTRLHRLLGEPVPHVIGYLECLWMRGYQTGDPKLGDALDVEAAAEYPGTPGKFADAALAAGFLDVTTDTGEYEIHNLYTHAPDYVRKRMIRVGTAPSGAMPSVPRSNSRRIGTHGSDLEPVGVDPAPTRSVGSELEDKEERREKREVKKTPLPPDGGDGLPDADQSDSPKNKPKPPPAESVPLPPELDTPAFRACWANWLADRRERRKAVTEKAARIQLADLTPLGPARAAECITASIAQGWVGLFPERFAGPRPGAPPPHAPAETPMERTKRIHAQSLADKARKGDGDF